MNETQIEKLANVVLAAVAGAGPLVCREVLTDSMRETARGVIRAFLASEHQGQVVADVLALSFALHDWQGARRAIETHPDLGEGLESRPEWQQLRARKFAADVRLRVAYQQLGPAGVWHDALSLKLLGRHAWSIGDQIEREPEAAPGRSPHLQARRLKQVAIELCALANLVTPPAGEATQVYCERCFTLGALADMEAAARGDTGLWFTHRDPGQCRREAGEESAA